MKKLFITLVVSVMSFAGYGQQQGLNRLTYTTTVGTGIALNKPGTTPFTWQVMAHYNISARFSAGAGTGLSFYEKMLIPLYGDFRYRIGRERKLTPFVHAAAGYAFAPDRNANGGYFQNIGFGFLYPIKNGMKLQFSFGYELQEVERLKTHTDDYFDKEFAEELNHSSLSIKVGLRF